MGVPLSPTGLSRQGTRKIGVLGRTSTINPLTRQATMNVSSAGSKRAQAVENLKQQVEELKAKLQVNKQTENTFWWKHDFLKGQSVTDPS